MPLVKPKLPKSKAGKALSFAALLSFVYGILEALKLAGIF